MKTLKYNFVYDYEIIHKIDKSVELRRLNISQGFPIEKVSTLVSLIIILNKYANDIDPQGSAENEVENQTINDIFNLMEN